MMGRSWLIHPTESVRRLLSYARGLLTWQLVRGVGELQILTRASYVMLALVPLLAGAWPSVRVIINRHNEMLVATTNDFAAAAKKLNDRVNAMAATAERPTAPLADVTGEAVRAVNGAVASLASEVSSLSAKVTEALATLRRQATLSPWLPSSWALAFFAALAVVFGHALYQSQAPDVVKRNTLIGYRRERRDAYKEQPDQYELEKALDRVRDASWKRVPSAEIKALENERRHKLKIGRLLSNPELLEKGLEPEEFESLSVNVSFSTPHDVKEEVLNDWACALDVLSISPDERKSMEKDEIFGKDTDARDAYAGAVTRAPLPPVDVNNLVRRLMRSQIEPEHINRLRSVLYWYDNLVLYDECRRLEERMQTFPDFAKAPAIQELKNELFKGMVIETYDVSRETMLAKGVDVVGEAASLEYLEESMKKPALIASALTLYAIGLTIVAILIFRQSAAVMEASGWI